LAIERVADVKVSYSREFHLVRFGRHVASVSMSKEGIT
jgi:hypothetical protein